MAYPSAEWANESIAVEAGKALPVFLPNNAYSLSVQHKLDSSIAAAAAANAAAAVSTATPMVGSVRFSAEASKELAMVVSASPSPASKERETKHRAHGEGRDELGQQGDWVGAWHVIFPHLYNSAERLRPTLRDRTFCVKVTEMRRLTPGDYDRNVFHIEFDIQGTGLKYGIGDALGVHAHNGVNEVMAFLKFYGVDPNSIIRSSRIGKEERGDEQQWEVRTALQLFSQVIDLFGRPSKKFYQYLADMATDEKEKATLMMICGDSAQGKAEFKRLAGEDYVTYADLLYRFKSAHPSVKQLIEIIPAIKARHYSIASSMRMHPDSVHLLVVEVSWMTKSGKLRHGQASHFLSNLQPGDTITVSVRPSVMNLPPNNEAPVIMAGLGTGMAPFRAFIQERAALREAGVKVGPMALYFGSRQRAAEYLYGEELEAYRIDGLLTRLRLAFSRDDPDGRKIYIQNKMQRDAPHLATMLLNQPGAFYLCGPTWPAPDVEEAIQTGFEKHGKLDKQQSKQVLEEMKKDERYVLEVY